MKKECAIFIFLIMIILAITLISAQICPDTNGDGKIDIYDLSFVGLYFNGSCNFDNSSDLNKDCIINQMDLKIIGKDYGCEEKCEGDTNNDGKVDVIDLAFIGLYFNSTCEYDEFADVNDDNKIDNIDLSLVADNYDCEGSCIGDTNNDKKVDIYDLSRIGLFYGAENSNKTSYNRLADLNNDCVINETDLAIIGKNYGCQGQCIGDTNNDGKVDVIDLGFIGLHTGSRCYNRTADLNKDCSVDEKDLKIMGDNYGCKIKSCIGDVNKDEKVDIADLARVGLYYGTKCYNEKADINNDCKVDQADLDLINQSYGKSCEEIEEETIECIDSDNGKKYFIRGDITGKDTNNYSYYKQKDSCLNVPSPQGDEVNSSAYLGEFYCEDNLVKVDIYTCPKSCKGGICMNISEPEPAPGFCSDGCIHNNTCLPARERILINKIPSYCSIKKILLPQKELDEKCQNDYECKSNECSDGKCINTYSLLQRIWNWIKRLFGID